MPHILTKILFFALILAFIVSCNTTKYVPENENLLKSNTIYVNDKKNRKEDLDKFVVQKPNQSMVGMPLSLHFYNLGNPDFEKTFEEWMLNHPKKYENYKNVFSKKQTRVIYNTDTWVNFKLFGLMGLTIGF